MPRPIPLAWSQIRQRRPPQTAASTEKERLSWRIELLLFLSRHAAPASRRLTRIGYYIYYALLTHWRELNCPCFLAYRNEFQHSGSLGQLRASKLPPAHPGTAWYFCHKLTELRVNRLAHLLRARGLDRSIREMEIHAGLLKGQFAVVENAPQPGRVDLQPRLS